MSRRPVGACPARPGLERRTVGEDPLLHACVLAYFSDRYSGLRPYLGRGTTATESRPFPVVSSPDPARRLGVDVSEPVSASRGRGVYRAPFGIALEPWRHAGPREVVQHQPPRRRLPLVPAGARLDELQEERR